MRVPSGNISDDVAALEDRARGGHRSWSDAPRSIGKAPSALSSQADRRVDEQLLLGHEVDRPARHASAMTNGSRNERWLDGDDHRPVGRDVLAPDARSGGSRRGRTAAGSRARASTRRVDARASARAGAGAARSTDLGYQRPGAAGYSGRRRWPRPRTDRPRRARRRRRGRRVGGAVSRSTSGSSACRYDDQELLGKAVTRGPAWQPVGLGAAPANGAAVRRASTRTSRRALPRARRGRAARWPALAEHLATWPLTLARRRASTPRATTCRRCPAARARSRRRPGATCCSASCSASSSAASTPTTRTPRCPSSATSPPTATATSSGPSARPATEPAGGARRGR